MKRMTMPRGTRIPTPLLFWPFLALATFPITVHAFAGVSTRWFHPSPEVDDSPKLILISGCTGTGKSTFGMSVALDQGILRCISTDTVRAVMRSFIKDDISPALHRSSYMPSGDGDDPVKSWSETCSVLAASVEGLVDDAMDRGVSLVVEGVHMVPSNHLIRKWEDGGGVALGCLLSIRDADAHKALLQRRGLITGKGEEKKLKEFDRVRAIQDEMIRLAKESDWLRIEQKLEPDPLEMVALSLYSAGMPKMDRKEAKVTPKTKTDADVVPKADETPKADEKPKADVMPKAEAASTRNS